jgi:hypothetical protein
MGEEIIPCAFFISFQGIVENELKVRGRRTGRLSVRHESRNGVFVRAERTMGL